MKRKHSQASSLQTSTQASTQEQRPPCPRFRQPDIWAIRKPNIPFWLSHEVPEPMHWHIFDSCVAPAAVSTSRLMNPSPSMTNVKEGIIALVNKLNTTDKILRWVRKHTLFGVDSKTSTSKNLSEVLHGDTWQLHGGGKVGALAATMMKNTNNLCPTPPHFTRQQQLLTTWLSVQYYPYLMMSSNVQHVPMHLCVLSPREQTMIHDWFLYVLSTNGLIYRHLLSNIKPAHKQTIWNQMTMFLHQHTMLAYNGPLSYIGQRLTARALTVPFNRIRCGSTLPVTPFTWRQLEHDPMFRTMCDSILRRNWSGSALTRKASDSDAIHPMRTRIALDAYAWETLFDSHSGTSIGTLWTHTGTDMIHPGTVVVPFAPRTADRIHEVLPMTSQGITWQWNARMLGVKSLSHACWQWLNRTSLDGHNNQHHNCYGLFSNWTTDIAQVDGIGKRVSWQPALHRTGAWRIRASCWIVSRMMFEFMQRFFDHNVRQVPWPHVPKWLFICTTTADVYTLSDWLTADMIVVSADVCLQSITAWTCTAHDVHSTSFEAYEPDLFAPPERVHPFRISTTTNPSEIATRRSWTSYRVDNQGREIATQSRTPPIQALAHHTTAMNHDTLAMWNVFTTWFTTLPYSNQQRVMGMTTHSNNPINTSNNRTDDTSSSSMNNMHPSNNNNNNNNNVAGWCSMPIDLRHFCFSRMIYDEECPEIVLEAISHLSFDERHVMIKACRNYIDAPLHPSQCTHHAQNACTCKRSPFPRQPHTVFTSGVKDDHIANDDAHVSWLWDEKSTLTSTNADGSKENTHTLWHEHFRMRLERIMEGSYEFATVVGPTVVLVEVPLLPRTLQTDIHNKLIEFSESKLKRSNDHYHESNVLDDARWTKLIARIPALFPDAVCNGQPLHQTTIWTNAIATESTRSSRSSRMYKHTHATFGNMLCANLLPSSSMDRKQQHQKQSQEDETKEISPDAPFPKDEAFTKAQAENYLQTEWPSHLGSISSTRHRAWGLTDARGFLLRMMQHQLCFPWSND